MTIEEIRSKIYKYKDEGKKLFTSSSFQSHSLVLLHILSQIDNTIPVYFLNTGYHFSETLEFREKITELFKLNTRDLVADTPRSMQKDYEGRLLFTSDPDHCCFINKVQPMEKVMMYHDVWINGVRKDQSKFRQNLKVEQQAPFETIRFHPMLDWTNNMIHQYRKEHQLPSHPLEEKGYLSIGCEPCTRKIDPEMLEREARWYGLNKTECGLNVDLVK